MNCWFKQLFWKRCRKKRTDDFNQIDMKTCCEFYPNVNEPLFYAVSTWYIHTNLEEIPHTSTRRMAALYQLPMYL